jgi:glucokinase
MAPERTYLVIDIGGTKTLLAIYSIDDTSLTPLEQVRYRSKEHGGIGEIISDFLGCSAHRPEAVAVDVAGVVSGNGTRAQVTNLPWEITTQQLHELGFSRAILFNDMTALAASLPLLKKEDLYCLQEGETPSGAVSGVLAPGTGLGQGFLYQTESDCFPSGTEGGHADFAPITPEQHQLATWLAGRIGRIPSYESVSAGPALGVLYDFYLANGTDCSEDVRQELLQARDRTPVIVDKALSGDCPACCKALDLFLAILGREAVNLILKVYATRGLFLGGSILPRLAGNYSLQPFMDAFSQPGQMDELLGTVPVNIIMRPDAVLLGAASFGRNRLTAVAAPPPDRQ